MKNLPFINILKAVMCFALLLPLSACGPSFQFNSNSPNQNDLPVFGSSMGSGPNKIALLLPQSSSNGAAIATSLRNATQIALEDTDQNVVTIQIYDTKGTSEGAANAALQAINDGSQVIIGPVFSHSVKSVRQVTTGRNIPVLAFSTDASAAGGNVFLMSFLPKQTITRVLDYAARKNKKSIAAVLPQNAYGGLTEAALRESGSSLGIRPTAIMTYQPNQSDMKKVMKDVASVTGGFRPVSSAILFSDTSKAMRTLASQFQPNDIQKKNIQILGSGLWYDPLIWQISALNGAWFASPDPKSWEGFRSDYKTKFNTEPMRVSTLAYDATSLVVALTKVTNGNITKQTLLNSAGFNGIDGLFRFLPNGLNERSFAILQIKNGAVSVIEHGAKKF